MDSWAIELWVAALAVAGLATPFLLEKLRPGFLKERKFRGFDLVVTAFVFLLAGLHLMNQWHLREEVVTAMFHRQFSVTWWQRAVENTTWFGTPVIKCPLDMWIFQEIINETRPDVIVETGTYRGGSAGFFASMFDLLGSGRVITVDIKDWPKTEHPRVTFLLGSSTSAEIGEQIKNSIAADEKVMVVLDSDHSKEHVLNELRLYSELVTVGNYLVVEDTHFNGRPIRVFEGDPWGAVQEFLATNSDFVIDESREKYGLTWNPGGWLKRVR